RPASVPTWCACLSASSMWTISSRTSIRPWIKPDTCRVSQASGQLTPTPSRQLFDHNAFEPAVHHVISCTQPQLKAVTLSELHPKKILDILLCSELIQNRHHTLVATNLNILRGHPVDKLSNEITVSIQNGPHAIL